MPQACTRHVTHVAERRQRAHAPGAVAVVAPFPLDEADRALQLLRQRDPDLRQLSQAEGVGVLLEPLPASPCPPRLLVSPRLLQVMHKEHY